MATDFGNLRAYYEHEAAARTRASQELQGGRVRVRDDVIDLLGREGRTSVVDVGAGPARDGEAFRAAGVDYLGIDLALGNAKLAAELGLLAVQASAIAAPFRDSAFDAGWSFSTLMHFDEPTAVLAMGELVRVVRPGAPVVVGVWGREEEASLDGQPDPAGRVRPFHLRSVDRNRRLLAQCAEVERADRWERTVEDWDYQVFLTRRPG